MTFKQWLIELFKDERGTISVKPVVAFIGTLFLCGTMLANSFSNKDFAPSPELVNAVMVITAIGMGADTLDKFTKKADADQTPAPTPTPAPPPPPPAQPAVTTTVTTTTEETTTDVEPAQ
jgi:hypothetical protein